MNREDAKRQGRAGRRRYVLPLLSLLASAAFFLGLSSGDIMAEKAKAAVRDVEEVRGWAIINLIRFSSWPAAAFEGPDSPLRVCSKPGLLRLPSPSLAGHERPYTVKGRPVELWHLADYRSLAACHVVYLDAGDMTVLPAILAAIETRCIALVSDRVGFAEAGGAFELIRNENTAFFRINAEALKRTGIFLTQDLMRLGVMNGHRSAGP